MATFFGFHKPTFQRAVDGARLVERRFSLQRSAVRMQSLTKLTAYYKLYSKDDNKEKRGRECPN